MTDYTKLTERLRTDAIFDNTTLGNEAADAIEAMQSKLGDAIQSSAHWQHQFTEVQAENERLKAEKAGLEHIKNAFADQMQALQAKLDAMGKGEQIYQYLMGDGSWIDQAKQSYDYNRNHAPHAVMRIVYAAPKALAPHEDTKLLDYLQARQATVEILMDGHGLSTPLFRIGGLHGTICADIRGAIGAAIESLKEPTP